MANITFKGTISDIQIASYNQISYMSFIVTEIHSYQKNQKTIKIGETKHYCKIWGENKTEQYSPFLSEESIVLVQGEQETRFSKEMDENNNPINSYRGVKVSDIALLPSTID